jgi:hypothetical protein
MSYENKAGLNVHNHYGPRKSGGAVGVERSQDSTHQLAVNITADSLKGSFIPPIVIPKGAQFLRYILTVNEAFAITGTTPAVLVGRATAEATDGISLSAAELGAVGVKKPASSGTGQWAVNASTTAAQSLGVSLTAGAVVGATGNATLIAEYIYKYTGK